ncbi:phage major capsid protein [Bradyrhizobium sp. JR18.2]|uniref:phage major capsid protein n=1 Tax=Bradyrhizobium sp. JR18.2 TaxID=3156369 RepID=UPI003397D01B
MASPNLGEIITTTLRNRTGKAADSVSKNNALLNRLLEKGKVDTADGGRTIVQEIEYQENGTFKRYAGYDLLNISPSDVLTAAEFDWKQAVAAISISGLEQMQNSGKEVMIKLLAARIKNAQKTLRNNIALDCYSDGTADGGKQIGGLQAAVPFTNNSGTYGGIPRATWAFWQNQAFNGLTNGGVATSATNVQSYMNQLWYKTTRGADHPDLIVADNTMYGFYHSSLQSIQRITSDKMAQAGFTSLKYMNADVVLDGGFGGGAPTSTMYFLNTDYIYLRPHSQRNFVEIGGERVNPNQDALVKLLGWMGNMTASNMFLQGVLT